MAIPGPASDMIWIDFLMIPGVPKCHLISQINYDHVIIKTLKEEFNKFESFRYSKNKNDYFSLKIKSKKKMILSNFVPVGQARPHDADDGGV